MSRPQILLAIAAAAAGLVSGALTVFIAPRLVAHRLEETSERPPVAILLPLIGVWITRWRPVTSLITQMVTAVAFAALALHLGAHVTLLLAVIDTAILATIAYVDFEHRLVLNRLTYPAIVFALGTSWFWPGPGVLSSATGAVAGLIIFAVLQLVGRGALGTGDTKLALLIGAMEGFPGVLNALTLGVALGGASALFFLVILSRGRKSYFAYAPYLAAGAVIAFFFGAP